MKLRFTLFLPLILAACLPDDGSPEETKALTIVSTNPVNGALDVDVDTALQLTFSKSIDFSKVDVSQVHLMSDVTGVEIPGLLDYDAQNFTLNFTPDYLLANNTEYSIQIDSGIADFDNQILGTVLQTFKTNDDYQFSFEVASEVCELDCDYELWRWDEFGNAVLLADINPEGSSFPYTYDMFRYKGLHFFSAETPEQGEELWVTDGTKGFTQLFMDLREGTKSSSPYGFTLFNDLLYFIAAADDGFRYIWRTDGTPEGTKPIANSFDNNSNHAITNLTVLGDRLLYVAYGSGETINGGTQFGWEVFATDGTDDVNYLVYDLNPGNGLSGAGNMVEMNGKVYFQASDGSAQHSYSLFTTDGTEGNMDLVKDINPTENENSEARIGNIAVINNRLLFSATNGVDGRQLWVSDGTTEGTNILKVLNEGSSASISRFIEFNGLLYFTEQKNNGLWVTDGTEAGTQLVKTFDDISNVVAIDSGLLFSAALGDSTGLWMSDGTDEGTLHYYPTTSLPYLYSHTDKTARYFDFNDELNAQFYTDGTFNGTFHWVSENGLPFSSEEL